jgi:hypothetical protein
MPMKRLTLFLLVILSFITEASMDSRIKKFKKLKSLTANFKQVKLIKSIGIKVKSTGTLTINNPDFFSWNVKIPSLLRFEYRKTALMLFENNKETMRVDTKSVNKDLIVMINFLKKLMVLDDHFISHNFKINKIKSNIYELVATSKIKIFKKALLEFGKGAIINKAIITEMSNDEITLTFTDHKTSYNE